MIIYANLHNSNYRKKYIEFLKIDFPYIPYPKIDTFWNLVSIGSKLREIHLMKSKLLDNVDVGYTKFGNNIVTQKPIIDKEDKVWINDKQYFSNVPLLAWNFYVGSSKLAQQWLKDKQKIKLSYDDISYYQKIIKIINRIKNKNYSIKLSGSTGKTLCASVEISMYLAEIILHGRVGYKYNKSIKMWNFNIRF